MHTLRYKSEGEGEEKKKEEEEWKEEEKEADEEEEEKEQKEESCVERTQPHCKGAQREPSRGRRSSHKTSSKVGASPKKAMARTVRGESEWSNTVKTSSSKTRGQTSGRKVTGHRTNGESEARSRNKGDTEAGGTALPRSTVRGCGSPPCST